MTAAELGEAVALGVLWLVLLCVAASIPTTPPKWPRKSKDK